MTHSEALDLLTVPEVMPQRIPKRRSAGLWERVSEALLASDPASASRCVRTGDRLVCVSDEKLGAFRKGLARLGLVLPETARG